MAIKYKMVEQISNIKCATRRIFKAQPLKQGNIDCEEVLKTIEKRTALSRGDVLSAISTLSDIITDAMQEGCSVDLGELGHFRPTFRSKAVENLKDFDTRTHIAQVKIVYLPSKQIKKRLSNIAFRKAKNK